MSSYTFTHKPLKVEALSSSMFIGFDLIQKAREVLTALEVEEEVIKEHISRLNYDPKKDEMILNNPNVSTIFCEEDWLIWGHEDQCFFVLSDEGFRGYYDPQWT